MNAGARANVKKGDRFLAYSMGEEFIDPDSGISLGAEEEYVGTLRVRDVKDKFSIAQIVEGRGVLKRGDIIKAGEYIDSFKIPASVNSLYYEATSLTNNHDYKGAETLYGKIIAQEPNFVLGYNNLAVALSGQGRYEESIRYYRKAIELEPKGVIFHKNLAIDLVKIGRYEEAKKEYEAALRLNPNERYSREQVLHLPGKILLEKNDNVGAETEYRKALNQLPDSHLMYNQLAVALYRQGKYADAVHLYRKAIELSPEDALYHNNLADTLDKLGRFEEAVSGYETAYRLDPKTYRDSKKRALNLKYVIQDEKGNKESAEQAFAELLKFEPNEAKAMWNIDALRAWRIRSGRPGERQGWLGIQMSAIDPEKIKQFSKSGVQGLPGKDVRGILILKVSKGSPAEKAGFNPSVYKTGAGKGKKIEEDIVSIGDVITEVDGQQALGGILSHLASKKPGESVSFKILKEGQFHTVTVKLGTWPKKQ
jgi:tetratricopeptide (TPR) repeat protein